MMSPFIRFLIFATACLGCVGTPLQSVLAQPRRSRPDSSDSVTVESIAEVEARIAEVRKLPGADAGGWSSEGPVALWAERPFLGIDNAYSGDGVRYLVVRLVILNRTESPVAIPRDRITLTAGEQSLKIAGDARQFRGMPLDVDGETLSQAELRTPERIVVKGGEAASCWCVFPGVAAVPISPSLKIAAVPDDGDSVELDLTAQQTARLGLQRTLLGPGRCLPLLTIHGQLNTINAGALSDVFEREFQVGRRRLIVDWSAGAKPSDELLLGWLLAGASESRDDPLYQTLPFLAPIQAIRLAGLPEENQDAGTWEEAEGIVFEKVEDAVVDVLSEVFRGITSGPLLAELATGHPLSRQAALRAAGDRCPPGALPLLLKLAEDPDPATRHAAFAALARQSDLRARTLLIGAVRGRDPQDRRAAFDALLEGDRDCVATVESMLAESPLPLDKATLVELLRQRFRPAWLPFLRGAVDDPDPTARAAGLRALRVLGHPELIRCCIEALQDPDDAVSSTAFEILVTSREPGSRRAAVNHALERLRQGEIDESGLRLLERARETRAAPIALQLIDRNADSRVRLIDFLAAVGSDVEFRRLLKDRGRFTPEEQAAICTLAATLPESERLATAREAVASEHFAVRYAGLEILQALPSAESLAILAELLDRADDDELELVADGIGELGTAEAIAVLRKYRLRRQPMENAEQALAVIDRAIRICDSQSPGWNSLESGRYHWQAENYDDAIKNFSLAVELDPDLAAAYSWRANSHLKQSNFDQARADFQKAWDLDPFDGQAATGLGITLSIEGKWEAGVRIAEEAAERFPGDHIYAYNTACVYGRALEFLMADEPEKNRKPIEDLQAKAIRILERAIELGFDEADLMRTDPDIASLRELPEFPRLLKQAESALEQ